MAVGFQVRAALAVSKVRAQRGRRPPGAGELSGATPIRRLALRLADFESRVERIERLRVLTTARGTESTCAQ